MKILVAVALATLVAGVVIALTLHSLLGPILIVGGTLGVGYLAATEWLARVATFLSTGSFRRR